MKFAPIVPNNKLPLIQEGFDYHLCLAHRVLEDPNYRSFYRTLADRDKVVIMDNSVHELGQPLDEVELLEAYQLVQPSIVILPDWPFNFDDSFHYLVNEASYLIENVEDVIDSDRVIEFMVCPHADIAGEEIDLANSINKMLKVRDKVRFKYMGICKDYEMMGEGRGTNGRANIVSMVADNLEEVQIHMLGIHKNPIGEVRSWRQFSDRISGFDSGIPYRITRIGRKMEEYYPYPPYMDEKEDILSTHMSRFVKEELIKLSKLVESL